jgi:hypothetical protein
VAAGAEKDSRAVDSTDDTLNADRFRGSQLHDEEKQAIDLLARLGFEYISHDAASLTFLLRDNRSPLPSSSRRSFPRAYVRMMLAQLDGDVEEHPDVTGLLVPSRGSAELILSQLGPAVAERVFRLESNDPDCVHKEPAHALPSLPYRWPGEDGGDCVKRVHLSGRDGEPCVEISNASPLAVLLYGHLAESGRVRLAYPRIPLLATVKIAYGSATGRDRLRRKSQETARSLIYELNVRNGVLVELAALPAGRDMTLARRPPEVSSRIRYPRTRMQYEVATLFGFASQAANDPPQAFLSYYQTLEYFIPAAIRQSAIEKIKRELLDPGFDEQSEASLLRLIKAAEGPIVATEPNQLRIVVNEYVRVSQLEEFFGRDWGDHFTREGPIKGVAHINMKSASSSLSDQVAERVYQIRNRIVHAKDDPRFGGARVLLPGSAESNALTPDVLLIRLLATEAISVG